MNKCTTSPHLQLQHHDEDPLLFVDVPDDVQILAKFLHRGFANTNDEWHTQYAAYQDNWPYDSLPACKDLTSVRKPVETVSNLSRPSLFFSVFELYTDLDMLSSRNVS